VTAFSSVLSYFVSVSSCSVPYLVCIFCGRSSLQSQCFFWIHTLHHGSTNHGEFFSCCCVLTASLEGNTTIFQYDYFVRIRKTERRMCRQNTGVPMIAQQSPPICVGAAPCHVCIDGRDNVVQDADIAPARETLACWPFLRWRTRSSISVGSQPGRAALSASTAHACRTVSYWAGLKAEPPTIVFRTENYDGECRLEHRHTLILPHIHVAQQCGQQVTFVPTHCAGHRSEGTCVSLQVVRDPCTGVCPAFPFILPRFWCSPPGPFPTPTTSVAPRPRGSRYLPSDLPKKLHVSHTIGVLISARKHQSVSQQ